MVIKKLASCKGVLSRSLRAWVFSLLATTAHAGIEGTVVGISDGDTITILDDALVQHKVRLAGIDAPEKKQAFGTRSKQSLSECAFGRRARVTGEKRDRYARLVGKVMVDGVDCNLRQVQAGLAWHYKQYQHEQSPHDQRTYDEAELKALDERRGLWQQVSPLPPWDYRRGLR